MSEIALEVRGLTRTYGKRAAVANLDLTVTAGDVYGFLGPNGAGKTTAIRCALGLIRKDAGQVAIFGERRHPAMLRPVGAIVETPSFYGWMTGRENLEVAAAYKGLRSEAEAEIARVLDRVGLTERARDASAGYSLGMRQRLAIARALLGRPKLLILDEPTNGLDPRGMREVRDLVRSLALHDGITVFISSHLLGEVQAICNRVGILQEGCMRAEGRVDELLAAHVQSRAVLELGASDPAALSAAIEAIEGATITGPGASGRSRIELEGLDIPELNRRLVAAGVAVTAIVPQERNLEEVFLEVTR